MSTEFADKTDVAVVEYATADEILATPVGGESDLAEEDVQVRPGLTVRVRELTRKQMLSLRDAGSIERTEAQMVSMALVYPALSVNQVQLWQERKGFRELEKVTRAISRLSGLEEKAGKEEYKSI